MNPSTVGVQGPTLQWDAAGLRERLAAQGWPAQVEVVAETGSTNSDLLEPVRLDPAFAHDRRVLVAEAQTAGRGRLGRQWISSVGDSLTFSLACALRPREGWGALSLALGYAVAESLQPWGRAGVAPHEGRLMLKWPNDLWWYDREPISPAQRLQGQKVAGILIETLPLPTAAGPGAAAACWEPGTRWVVVGMGINIQAPALAVHLAAGGAPTAAAIPAGTARWRPQDSAPAIAHRVIPAVCQALAEFEIVGFAPVRAAVQARDVLVGQAVTLSAGPVAQGICCGIDADGALLVQSPAGIQRVVAGEVQVRPNAPHPASPS